MRTNSQDGAGPRTGVRLWALAVVAAAAACGRAEDRPAGDTGRAAPAGTQAGAVDTAHDSVTTGAALNSTDRPVQPPGGDSAGARGGGAPAKTP